jgi:hypothetical protein
MASKLGVYNSALLLLSSRSLTALTDDTANRRYLDAAYADAVALCIEAAYWTWAMRTSQIDKSVSVVPTFGLANAFAKPTDWVRTYRISDNEMMQAPVFDLVDEGGYWYSDADPLYVKYVSNDATYGNNLSLWTATFADYVAARLALKACISITGSDSKLDDLVKYEKSALQKAADKDAMNEPPAFPARGSWVSARRSATSFAPPSNRTITN